VVYRWRISKIRAIHFQPGVIGTHRNPSKQISKAFENNATLLKTILGAHISRNPRVNGGKFQRSAFCSAVKTSHNIP
jgi:hypothetical protein